MLITPGSSAKATLAIVGVLLLCSCGREKLAVWPSIAEISVVHRFVVQSDERFEFPVAGLNGQELYRFDARFNAGEHDAADYSYSGTLDCRLYVPGDTTYPSLFQNVRAATRDWQTDGRFLEGELLGLVDAPSTRTIVQRCRLRGMSVELEVFNVRAVLDGGTKKIASLDLRAVFRNDPNATEDISVSGTGSAADRK